MAARWPVAQCICYFLETGMTHSSYSIDLQRICSLSLKLLVTSEWHLSGPGRLEELTSVAVAIRASESC